MSGITLIIGPLLAAGLVLFWLSVQRLWGRVFGAPDGTDVLDDRRGCLACPRARTCQDRTNRKEDRHDR